MTTPTPPDVPELKSCPFCGRDAWYQYSPPMVKCSVCPARSWDCGSRSEAYAAWNTRAETRPTPPADAMPNDLDGTEYEWKLAVPEEDAVKRPLQEAIDYKWHHVLNANGGYKFEEFSKETWGALPIGVIETLRIAAIRYRALQSPAPVTDAHRIASAEKEIVWAALKLVNADTYAHHILSRADAVRAANAALHDAVNKWTSLQPGAAKAGKDND